jgi:hypothetical protein
VSGQGLKKICPNLDTADKGCIRYVQGFDVTGVTTEILFTYSEGDNNKCDCIQRCINNKYTCTSWVYKFSDRVSVHTGQRTCTLYSNTHLPPDVTLTYNINDSDNIDPLRSSGNPQKGGKVPHAYKDRNLNTDFDNGAFSGILWFLADGKVIC